MEPEHDDEQPVDWATFWAVPGNPNAAAEGLHCTLLDERPIESLPELFLPGMLIEITVLPEVGFPTGGVKSICQPGTMSGYSSR